MLIPGILCIVLNYVNYIPLLKMMPRRDVAHKYVGDGEMDDKKDQGRLPCIVSHSVELHQLLVVGLKLKLVEEGCSAAAASAGTGKVVA